MKKGFGSCFTDPVPVFRDCQKQMTDLEDNGSAGIRGKMERVGVEGK